MIILGGGVHPEPANYNFLMKRSVLVDEWSVWGGYGGGDYEVC